MPYGAHVRIGDATDLPFVTELVRGADVVFSTVGARDIERPLTDISGPVGTAIVAMQANGVRRFLGVGSSGALDHPDGGLALEATGFPEAYRHISDDHVRAVRLLQASDLAWTYVCPPFMPDGERTGRYVFQADVMPAGRMEISAEDVADLLLKLVGASEFEGRRVGVTYP